MTTVLFRFFVGIWENLFGLAHFFLSIYPSSYSILILYAFFPKKIFWFWILKKQIWLDRRTKYIPTSHFHSIIVYLPFSQYNHIQNFEEKKLFQHFANLIKIRSTHLLPILDLIIPPLPEGGGGILFYLCPSVLPKYFSQQLLMAEICYLVTSFIWVCHIVGSVFGTIRFLLPVCRLSWFLSTLLYMHIFLNNYWWQKSGNWSQASYRYPISWEVAGVS